jgi:hypothetical protein
MLSCLVNAVIVSHRGGLNQSHERVALMSKKKERGYAMCAAGIVIFTIRLPESYSLKFVPESCA